MTAISAREQTRILVQAAAAACEDKKAIDTRILELDAADSGLADFFLIASASNNRQSIAIADEIELRLKREFGAYARSVEGRRLGEWILLDYVDFVVHVFLTERREFYDIERLRKSARPLSPSEFDAELKVALTSKTRTARKKTSTQKAPGTKKTLKPIPVAMKATVKKDAAAVKKAAAAKKTSAVKKAVKKTAQRAKRSK